MNIVAIEELINLKKLFFVKNREKNMKEKEQNLREQ